MLLISDANILIDRTAGRRLPWSEAERILLNLL